MSIHYFDVDKESGALSFSRRVRDGFSRERHITEIIGESRTHQSHKESSDVNWIIARYERTGELPRTKSDGIYADVSGLSGDLMDLKSRADDVISVAGDFLDKRAIQAAAEKAAAEKAAAASSSTP